MENKKSVSVFRAIGNGTAYFFRNFHLAFLFALPLPAFWAWFYIKNGNVFVMDFTKMITPGMILMFFVWLFLWTWAFNFLIIHVVSKSYVLNLGIKNQVMTALKRLPGMLAVWAMFCVCMMLAMLLLLIPGIIVACVWSMVVFVYILNGGMIKSFEEGRELVRGYAWKVFGLILVFFIIYIAAMVPVFINPGIFMSFPGVMLYGVYILLAYLFYFWLIAFYRELVEAKSYAPDGDRKGKSGFYRFFMALSMILAAAGAAGYVYLFAVVMPAVQEKTGMVTRTEGKKTTTYVKGVPHSAVEYGDKGVVNYTYYYPDGAIKTEMSMRFISIVGEKKDYHENGKLKMVTPYEKGKMNGTALEYDNKGKLIRKCEYNNDELGGCKDVK